MQAKLTCLIAAIFLVVSGVAQAADDRLMGLKPGESTREAVESMISSVTSFDKVTVSGTKGNISLSVGAEKFNTLGLRELGFSFNEDSILERMWFRYDKSHFIKIGGQLATDYKIVADTADSALAVGRVMVFVDDTYEVALVSRHDEEFLLVSYMHLKDTPSHKGLPKTVKQEGHPPHF